MYFGNSIFRTMKKPRIYAYYPCFVHGAALNSYLLIRGAQFSAAGVDFVQVALDGLQVGDTIATTQLQDQLQRGNGGKQVTQKSMTWQGQD